MDIGTQRDTLGKAYDGGWPSTRQGDGHRHLELGFTELGDNEFLLRGLW